MDGRGFLILCSVLCSPSGGAVCMFTFYLTDTFKISNRKPLCCCLPFPFMFLWERMSDQLKLAAKPYTEKRRSSDKVREVPQIPEQ